MRLQAVDPPRRSHSGRYCRRPLRMLVYLDENFFARLEQFRAIATRYDKTARYPFLAGIHLAATLIWLN